MVLKVILKFQKFNVADSVKYFSYKVELIVNNVKTFSRLVKIEFK